MNHIRKGESPGNAHIASIRSGSMPCEMRLFDTRIVGRSVAPAQVISYHN